MAECQDGNQGSGIAMASDSQFSEITSPASEAGPFFPRFAPVRLAHERLGLTSLRILLPFEISARRRS